MIDDVGSGAPRWRPERRTSPPRGAASPPVPRSSASPATSCSAARRPGIAVGQVEAIERMRAHPLARAMRIDKLSLAALEATLRLHLGSGEVPALRMLAADDGALEARARRLAGLLGGDRGIRCRVAAPEVGGGGSLPERGVPGCAVRSRRRPERRAAAAAARWRSAGDRAGPRDGALLLHVRTLTKTRRRNRRGRRACRPRELTWPTTPLTLGTAGHIDHGKTVLVGALTGQSTRIASPRSASAASRSSSASLRWSSRRPRAERRRRPGPRAVRADDGRRRDRGGPLPARRRRRRRRDAADARARPRCSRRSACRPAWWRSPSPTRSRTSVSRPRSPRSGTYCSPVVPTPMRTSWQSQASMAPVSMPCGRRSTAPPPHCQAAPRLPARRGCTSTARSPCAGSERS